MKRLNDTYNDTLNFLQFKIENHLDMNLFGDGVYDTIALEVSTLDCSVSSKK